MMDRLTIRREHGIVMVDGYDFGIDPDDYDVVQKTLARLAEYEDTGLEPETIRNVVQSILTLESVKGFDYLKSLVDAHAEGRLMFPPCVVGQTVYFVLEDLPYFYPETNGWYISESEVSEVCTRGFSVDPIDGDEKILFYPYSDIGETVFLTREEAEEALEDIRHENP